MSTPTLEEAVEKAIKGGCTVVQLREKNCSSSEFYQTAVNIRRITRQYQVPLIINDRVDIALAVDADGVHVGQSDMAAFDVRKMIGEDKILGVSAQTVEQAIEAERCKADYIGVGAVFGSTTKLDASLVSYDTLSEICASVSVPVVAIGGINEGNVMELKGSGVSGVAVISAIFAREDVRDATARLLRMSGEMVTYGQI